MQAVRSQNVPEIRPDFAGKMIRRIYDAACRNLDRQFSPRWSWATSENLVPHLATRLVVIDEVEKRDGLNEYGILDHEDVACSPGKNHERSP